VPVDQDVTGRVTVAFKDYGVGLGFTPVVLSGGRIQLKLTTEVSELSQQGAFSLATSSGSTSTSPQLVIPGLVVRRANTTVEMASGGSLMIAGLLEDKSSQDLDALPGIKDLPILGALFRSRDYLSGETELVVIVTPYLVNPVSAGQLQTPADGLEVASDHDTILLGRLNKTFNHESSAPTGRTYQGPYGYVVE
jgi:pilus assembly protein CpaC